MDGDLGRLRKLMALRMILGLSAGLVVGGCSHYVGTTVKSFLRNARHHPDPNVRFVAYSKLASLDAYESPEEKSEAVKVLMERFDQGREPVASRAMICRALGQLGDPAARELLIRATSHPEGVIKIEACRALGKVGRSEDATILARIMTVDHLEDARIAAIEGLAELRTKDPRIYLVLVEGMDHDDPAIRLASLNALRKLTGKDLGVTSDPWRRELKPILDAAARGDSAMAVGDGTADTDTDRSGRDPNGTAEAPAPR